MSNADKVKPVVKVYGLPKMNEGRLRNLHVAIVSTASVVLEGLHIKSEEDLLVWFLPDSMAYGLGSEILVEVDLPMNPAVSGEKFLPLVSARFGNTVKAFFPDSFVQCTPYRFDPANSWTS